MNDLKGWSRSDEGNLMVVTVALDCGHRIIADENDGGMDEVARVTWKLLEDVAMHRVTTHAVLGCDIVWAGKMFIEKYRQAQADYAQDRDETREMTT